MTHRMTGRMAHTMTHTTARTMTHPMLRIMKRAVVVVLVGFLASMAACSGPSGPFDGLTDPDHTIIPLPSSVTWAAADTFRITEDTRILFDEGDGEGERIGQFLSGLIGNSTETRPPVEANPPAEASISAGSARPSMAPSTIHLTRVGVDPALGDEGYTLDVTSDGVRVTASTGAGLFYGIQTLRHLLPPVIGVRSRIPRSRCSLLASRSPMSPRFGWRGLMLDVSRHFLEVHEVKRFIDLAALYKVNRLHLHLSDDQGWRIEIPGWPRLTEYGGELEVGGTPGGFYTLEDYAEIVRYAADHFIMVVPEIDVPGHTNAALASYAELNCDGVATERFTGTAVGFSALCVEKEITYAWLNDVIREISAVTPGDYFHVGGDEVENLSEDAYNAFIERVQGIVQSHGKRMVGWDEIAKASLDAGAVVQLWHPSWPTPEMEAGDPQTERAVAFEERILQAVEGGAQILLSPANRVYLDLKYDTTTMLGLTWAGIPNVQDAYDWDPQTMFPSLPEEAIAGIEAPLWSETVATVEDFEYMAFPPAGRGGRIGVVGTRGPVVGCVPGSAWVRSPPGGSRSGSTSGGSPLVPWHLGPRDP